MVPLHHFSKKPLQKLLTPLSQRCISDKILILSEIIVKRDVQRFILILESGAIYRGR